MSASIALRQGDRQRALQLAEEALAVCREHGMGHIGPWVHGVRALVETDSRARLRFLEEGETQLALGCVSHNHIHLRELAVDVCLEVGAWNEVEQNCQLILDYTAQEPLPLAAFIVARGRALARFGRGERSAALRTDLTDLADLAGHAELNFARIAVDEALVAFGEAGEAAVTATNG